jgi:ketosteroid isomerase-like protein
MFFAALLFFSLECASQQSDQLTQQQTEQIKSEVKAVYEDIMAKWMALDADGFLKHYSPELICVSGGLRRDFEAYKKNTIGLFNSTATVKVTRIREDFIVLTKDFVMGAGVYRVELSLKSGEKKMTQNVYSDVLKKVGGQWKAIYEHGSSTPVAQKADK